MLAINIAIVYNWPLSNLASTAVSFVKDKTGCQSIVHFALVYQFILFCHLSVDRKSDIEKWGVLFMMARTLFVPCYIFDLDIFRTFTFMVGSFSCIAIMMVSV